MYELLNINHKSLKVLSDLYCSHENEVKIHEIVHNVSDEEYYSIIEELEQFNLASVRTGTDGINYGVIKSEGIKLMKYVGDTILQNSYDNKMSSTLEYRQKEVGNLKLKVSKLEKELETVKNKDNFPFVLGGVILTVSVLYMGFYFFPKEICNFIQSVCL